RVVLRHVAPGSGAPALGFSTLQHLAQRVLPEVHARRFRKMADALEERLRKPRHAWNLAGGPQRFVRLSVGEIGASARPSPGFSAAPRPPGSMWHIRRGPPRHR